MNGMPSGWVFGIHSVYVQIRVQFHFTGAFARVGKYPLSIQFYVTESIKIAHYCRYLGNNNDFLSFHLLN